MQPFRARSWIVASLAVSGLMLATPHCSNVAGPSGSAAAGACGANPSSDDDEAGSGAGPCAPSDSDGIVGGCSVFDVTVNDTGFSPFILKAENLGQVTLTLKNTGTKPHDFAVGCVPIALAGCPPLQCFPAAAGIAPLAPGDSATTSFTTPNLEGIYTFRSDVPGDSQVESDGGVTGIQGQFVVQ